MITYKELFIAKGTGKNLPEEYSEAGIALMPKGRNIWPIFYTASSPPTILVNNEATLAEEKLALDVVESTTDWIIREEDTYKISNDILSKLELDLPFSDYTKESNTYIPQNLPTLVAKLPEIHYKPQLNRVYVGFIFYVGKLTPYIP